MRPSGLMINIELKNSVIPILAWNWPCLTWAEAHRMTNQICLSSFNHYSMVLAAKEYGRADWRCLADCSTAAGSRTPGSWPGTVMSKALHPHYAQFANPWPWRGLPAAGIRLNAWTIDRLTISASTRAWYRRHHHTMFRTQPWRCAGKWPAGPNPAATVKEGLCKL